jgi:hypothetical protein
MLISPLKSTYSDPQVTDSGVMQELMFKAARMIRHAGR